MITYNKAIKELLKSAKNHSQRIEKINILDSQNRISAESIRAKLNLPTFDNSGLDGYAFRYKDGKNNRRLISTIKAGDKPLKKTLLNGEAIQIMTGAPMPKGADTVIAKENTSLDGDTVHFLKIPEQGQAVRMKGTDFSKSISYIKKGTILEPKHILALAALGINEINVFEKFKISLISTGSEIASNDTDLQLGMVYNSTTPLLKSLAEREEAHLSYDGHIGDNPATFQKTVEDVLAQEPDLLITTGAVSMGTEDYVPEVFERVKIKRLFHRVAIKPGKPIWCGYKGKTLVLGLPGNPLSTYIGWKFFVAPYFSKIYYIKEFANKKLPLNKLVKKPKHLRCFYKAKQEGNSVEVLEGQESYRISSLLKSNCFAVLPEGKSLFKKGEKVEVYDL